MNCGTTYGLGTYETSKPHSPSGTLQKGHAYYNKATPPNNATLYELIGASYIQTTTLPDLGRKYGQLLILRKVMELL